MILNRLAIAVASVMIVWLVSYFRGLRDTDKGAREVEEKIKAIKELSRKKSESEGE